MRHLTRDARNPKGVLLVTVIILSGVMIALSSALWMYEISRSKANTALLDGEKALTFADGGTEIAARAVLDALADYGTVPTSGTFSSANGQTGTYTVTPIGSPWTSTDATGLTVLNQQYEIASTVTEDDMPSTVTTIITAEQIPVFQFLAFYNGDLEVLPGPTMTLSGRIHTNEDLYIGSNATLTLNTQYVKSAEKMYRKRKDGAGATMPGTVKGQVAGTSTYVNWNNGVDSTLSTWSATATANWGGTVQSDVHGVEPLSVPTVPSVAIDGYFHENAGLVIVDGQAYNGYGGANVTSLLPAGTIATQNVYDAREGVTVATTKIDISKLNGSSYFPANGLIYAAKTDVTVANPTAILLVNGSTLAAPLTVVSQNPVYIKGDYNTVAKKPAAVMSDACNLLSNAWAYTKTSSNGLPVASNTTYNLAFIAGDVPTPGGGATAYSGGFENYPRMHENWTGKTMTIRGSFVNLWASQYAKDAWIYGSNKYTAPTRNWDYDTLFNDPNTLPPFTPKSARVQRVAWDSE